MRLDDNDALGTSAVCGAHVIKIESRISGLLTASAGSGVKAADLQVTKLSTGITGIPVHKNPLPVLSKLYENTLAGLATLPEHSVYRQGTEAVVRHKLSILNSANGDIAAVEKGLDEGQIEESLLIAEDELNLVGKVAEWKSYVYLHSHPHFHELMHVMYRWDPLEVKPDAGQWEYFGKQSNAA